MPKKLIVCCDGTWNTADQPNTTNVFKLAKSLREEDSQGDTQLPYYRQGVGTREWERVRGGAFGMGLSSNVRHAYEFLVEAYEPGDTLYLFGFSRGAFTVRSLAGLVRNSGILRRASDGRMQEAWDLYRNRTEVPTSEASMLFRRSYSYQPGIHFVGVWDTVGTLGIPALGPRFNREWGFHDTELSSSVKGAFHALAIDEQRPQFAPTLWHQKSSAARNGQELKQVWFAGVHCDVGGGYESTALSDITLLWMVHQAHRYGLEFETKDLGELKPDSMGEKNNSRTGFYRLRRRRHRPIGQAADHQGRLDGCEYLSDTAQKRYDSSAEYRPPNLEDARRRQVPIESV